MSLNDVATVNVSTTSAGVTRAGFGIPMILSHTAAWAERFRTYSGIASVGADFAQNTPEYMAANKIFSQSPRPPQILIGRAVNQPTQKFSIGVQQGASGPVALPNNSYKLRVAGATGAAQWVSQDAEYIGGGATVWSPSGTWSKGDLITNDTGKLYSCLGQSGVLGGATGIGGASGPSGTSAAFADNQLFWMYAGTGNTGAISSDAIIAGLKARVDALPAPAFSGTGTGQFSTSLQGAVGSRTLQLLANAPAKFFGARVYNRAALSIAQTQADPGIAADLAAVALASKAWYGLVTLFNSQAIIDAAAGWVESNTKLYAGASLDSAIATVADSVPATDVAHDLKAAAYARSWIFHHPSNDEFAGAAEMGRFFPISPGGETWRMKTLTGVTEEQYTDSEIANMKGKYVHFYYDMGGTPVVGGDAKLAANEYVDSVRFIDWYTANLQADLADLLIQSEKVPMTDPGIDQIEAKVTKRNAAGIRAGGIAADPPPTVTAPDAKDISTTDKQNRELNGVVSTWELAQAVHHITVSVTASP